MTDVVYFFDMGDIVKVGFSTNLRDRPAGLIKAGVYLGAMLGGKQIEQTFLDEFAAFRAHGEYFYRDPIVLGTISRVLKTYGVSGEECVRLTDADVSPAEAVDRRDCEIRRKCEWIVKEAVARIATEKRIPVKAAIGAFSDLVGVTHSLVWELKYRPPSTYISAAQAEAIFRYADQGGIVANDQDAGGLNG